MSPRTRQSTITFPATKGTFQLNPRVNKGGKIDDTPKKRQTRSGTAKKEGEEVAVKNDTPTRTLPSTVASLTPSSAFATLKIDTNTVNTSSTTSAQKALHSLSVELPCRESELLELQDFLTSCWANKNPGSMYISGLPGTGKTAALLYLMERKEISREFQMVLANCTAVRSANSIYQQVASSLNIKGVGKTEKSAINAIEKFIKRSSNNQKMILLVLDEIDQLSTKFQKVLYKIFEWPSLENSRLVLIGIANAVDLTDRVLPRLRALPLQPKLVHFKPYTKEQIVTILRHRLAQTEDAQLFAPGSLELISAKVAGQSGDLRRALDLGRRVLEVSRPRSTNNLTLHRRLFDDDCEVKPVAPISNTNTGALRRSPRKIEKIGEKLTPQKREQIAQKTPSKNETPPTTPSKGRTPRKNEISESSIRKRTFSMRSTEQASFCDTPKKTPRGKIANDVNMEILEKENVVSRPSPRKPCCVHPLERTPCKDLFIQPTSVINSPVLRSSPRKQLFQAEEKVNMKQLHKVMPIAKSPLKVERLLNSPRRSPRKLNTVNHESFETLSVSSTPALRVASPLKPHQIRAADVISVVNQMSASARNLRSEESAFPLHQKLLICTLMLLLTKGKNKDINVGKLSEVYGRVCSRRGISAVDQSGFISLCRQVEMAGGLQIGKGPARLAKVSLQWDETEVAHALKDSSLLTAILNDTQVLSRK